MCVDDLYDLMLEEVKSRDSLQNYVKAGQRWRPPLVRCRTLNGLSAIRKLEQAFQNLAVVEGAKPAVSIRQNQSVGEALPGKFSEPPGILSKMAFS